MYSIDTCPHRTIDLKTKLEMGIYLQIVCLNNTEIIHLKMSKLHF